MNDRQASTQVNDPLAQQWEKGYSVGMHLTTIAMTFFLPVVAPLIMWLIKRQESPYVDDHGKEAVNFQITLTLYGIAAILLTLLTAGLGAVIIWPALYGFAIVAMIMAAVAAGNGRYFRYPACIRLVK